MPTGGVQFKGIQGREEQKKGVRSQESEVRSQKKRPPSPLGLSMSHIFCWTPGVRALLMPK